MNLPWLEKPLSRWSIVGMNHYSMKGIRWLFVAMVKDGICIRAEGRDEAVWNDLVEQAEAIEGVSGDGARS